MSAPARPPVLNPARFVIAYAVALVLAAVVVGFNLDQSGNLSLGAAVFGVVVLAFGSFSFLYPIVVQHYAKLRTVNGEMRELADQQFQYLREALDQARAREQVLQAYIEKLATCLAHNEKAAENAAASHRALQERWENLIGSSGESTEAHVRQTLEEIRSGLGETLAEVNRSLGSATTAQRETAEAALSEIRLSLAETLGRQQLEATEQRASSQSIVAEVHTRLADMVQMQQATQEKALGDLRSRLSELSATQEQLAAALPVLAETRDRLAIQGDRLQALSQGLPREETMQATLETLKDRTMFFGQQFVEIKTRLETADQRSLALQELFQQMVSTTAALSRHLPTAGAPATTPVAVSTPSPAPSTPASAPSAPQVSPAASPQAVFAPAPLPPPPPADAEETAAAAEESAWWDEIEKEADTISTSAPISQPSFPKQAAFSEDLFAVAKQGSVPVSLREVNWDDDLPSTPATPRQEMSMPVSSGGGGAQALRKQLSVPGYLTRPTRAPFAIGAAKVARHKADNPAEAVIVCIASIPEGQALYLRGEGSGLFKTAGVPMTNPIKGVWEWRVEASGPVTFRLHLNDETPAELSELTVHPGEMLEIGDPRFGA